MVEKSPITGVLSPSVWCASPGTSPGTYVGFSCSSDGWGCAQPSRPGVRAGARYFFTAPPQERAAPGWRRGGAGGGPLPRSVPSRLR